MSAFCTFTPVVVDMAWPALSACIASAMVSMGCTTVATAVSHDAAAAVKNTVELDVKQSQGFEESLGEQEELAVQRGSVTLTFRKGADGKLKICASGVGVSDEDLRAAGTEAMGRFLQAYVREKVTVELKKKGFKLEEEQLPDGTIRLSAKKWD